jgi:glycosyltransferase involved in cell wall biosynthesis
MLAILTTHPIQYQVPLWQRLAKGGQVQFEVWYLSGHGTRASHDVGFGQSFAWDLDMLSAYPHRFLEAAAAVTPNSFWKCRASESLAERMRDSKVKAVWIQGWQVAGYWQAVWAAKKIGAEVWLRAESNDLAPRPFWKRGLRRLILNQLFRRVDRFLYIGSANRRLYENFGVSADRLFPAPYAVDNNRFAAQAELIRGQRSEIRRQWKIPEEAFCILFCGKFIPKKRPLDLVKAAQLLLADNLFPSIHLLFVGSGELGLKLRANCDVVYDADSLPATTNKEAITDNQKTRSTFAGFLNQTEISKAYLAADCLVLPSDYGETWGLVVNEAMASGLQCIISDQCGCAQDLGSCRGNAVFACASISELSSAIARVAGSQRLPAEAAELPSIDETVATVAFLCSILSIKEEQPKS